MSNISIFASGSGSNAENIINFFRPSDDIHVNLILTNNPDAGVIRRAEKLGIDHFVFNRSEFRESSVVLDKLKEYEADLIVLAGFLWLVPGSIIEAFPGAIINIHPALLPKYGGKGMYGNKVHETVIANGEKESGITIHYVNERYDDGNIIFQARCKVDPNEDTGSLAEKVHSLEYKHYPQVIEDLIMNR